MRGSAHLDRPGGGAAAGPEQAKGARVLRAAFRQHSGGWRGHRSRSCEAVVQDQQEAAAAPAVVSRRRARRLGPSAALVEGDRRISFWGFLPPARGSCICRACALRNLEFLTPLSLLTRLDSTRVARVSRLPQPRRVWVFGCGTQQTGDERLEKGKEKIGGNRAREPEAAAGAGAPSTPRERTASRQRRHALVPERRPRKRSHSRHDLVVLLPPLLAHGGFW